MRDEDVAMAQVIVERSFEEPVERAAIQAVEDRGARCVHDHRARLIRTWFSKDRRRMASLYEAPDAESVRIALREAGMPVDRVWSATYNRAPAGWPEPPPDPHEHVVAEGTFEEPITPGAVAALLDKGEDCLPRHRVVYLGSHIALSGRRMLCIFVAPDAESVRIASREAGAPFDRIWTATLYEPVPPA